MFSLLIIIGYITNRMFFPPFRVFSEQCNDIWVKYSYYSSDQRKCNYYCYYHTCQYLFTLLRFPWLYYITSHLKHTQTHTHTYTLEDSGTRSGSGLITIQTQSSVKLSWGKGGLIDSQSSWWGIQSVSHERGTPACCSLSM